MADPVLEGRGLTKRFGGLVAVNGVDIAVERGEILGLIGPNGAGKSTLFRLIAGVMKPSAGSVAFNGRAITGRSAHDICVAGVAVTHQIVRPFREMSVLDNVMVGAFFGHRPRPRGRARARRRDGGADRLRARRPGRRAAALPDARRSHAARDRARARDAARGTAAR